MSNERTRQVDAVVLDYGGVLTVSVRQFIDDWLREERVDTERYADTMRGWLSHEAAVGNPVHLLETGELTVAEFEALLAAELRTLDGAPVPAAGLLRRMFGRATPDPDMIELVRDAQALGLRTALLSNSWGEGYPEALLAELFEVVVISGRIGLRKPDPQIYQYLLDQLDMPADRCVFLDDSPANVTAAQDAGLHAFRHADAASSRAALSALVPALAGTAHR
ncbi:HAD family hydrolase [Solihabitans fulvus]|uniref:HAD family hydrolase n=1 Tax=Solihabitans fulvus TaxID=1892852 RepID=UPI001CB7664F|nr:HAD family phosphatase [Solihabitans fulvus]